ncbi:MAG: FAD-dependent oxidoreductase [Anaerolineae bacterium]
MHQGSEASIETIRESARDVPIVADVDLCVVGGSTTGLFAAVAAARLGARVALVERLGYFGGSATASLVCVWHSRMDTSFERVIVGGLPIELMDRLASRDAVTVSEQNVSMEFIFSPAEMILELDRMVEEAGSASGGGIRPFLHTQFVAAATDEDGRPCAAIIEDKTGRRAIKARVFVDASGDADLAHRIGLPTYKRDAPQPPTTCALFQGLRRLRSERPDFSLNRVVFDPQYPEALRPGFLWTADLPSGDLTMVAGTRIHGADCSDADERTRAEIEGRRQVRAMLDLVRRHVPGGEAVTLQGLPSRIGIRETRHVRCRHRLTEDEVLGGKRFPDAVANGSYRVDVHAAEGDGLTFRYLDGREVTALADGSHIEGRWREPQEDSPTFYQVPYRSLVPRGATNVLVAGRCIDADEGAFGGVRVMINTAQMGEAAGVAAWLAVERRCDVGDVDAQELRGLLAEQGAVVI